jgi:Ca2+-binding RTX toxin-like protein
MKKGHPMNRFLERLQCRAASFRHPKRPKLRPRTLTFVEPLEDRRLMTVDLTQAVSTLPPPVSALVLESGLTATPPVFSALPGASVRASFNANTGILRVVGTEANDQFRVVESLGRLRVELYVPGVFVSGQGVYTPLGIRAASGSVDSLEAISVKSVEMYGWGGNDVLRYTDMLNSPVTFARTNWAESFVVRIAGDVGNDTLEVSAGITSSLDGGAGSDRLVGGWGYDKLFGGDGNDTLFGNGDSDVLRGDAGDDRLYGGDGHDILLGGLGNDRMAGEKGNDTLRGEDGNDVLIGAFDGFAGEPGADILYGGAGDDVLYGGDGRDTLWGDAGFDVLLGENGRDRLFGGDQDDRMYGGNDDDELNGEAGNDRIAGENGNDRIYGGMGNDVLIGAFDGWAGEVGGADLIYGGEGHDYLYGGDGAAALYGEAGHDVLMGENGNDNLYGGNGDDALYGGAGQDGIFGGGGSDRAWGGTESDRFLTWQDGVLAVFDLSSFFGNEGEDAVVHFVNSPAATPNLNGFGNVSFAQGRWTEKEVINVDVALNNLHHHAANARLLKTASQGRVTLQRVGAQLTNLGNTIDGWNSNGEIAVTDTSFGSDQALWQTVYHEFGHNWDRPDENAYAQDFRNLSGWVESDAQPSKNHLATKATDDKWWYVNPDQFARDYGKSNPLEDYATTWETYFMNRYHGTTMGNKIVQAKLDNLDRLFAMLG